MLNTIKRSMAHSLEHDGLTGLYTIQKFSQCVKRNLENNQDTKFTFIRLDIERFKMINNFYGVEAGDRLLVYISGLIETYWQDVENCVFGRIDGDVFGICFPKDEKKLNGFILYIKRELKSIRRLTIWKQQWESTTFWIITLMSGTLLPVQRSQQSSAKAST